MKGITASLILSIVPAACMISSAHASIQIGDKPKLVISDFKGETFDLSKQKGKWVILNFFASWCPGCKTELPLLQTLYQKYHPLKLEMLALSPEPPRRKKDLQEFMKSYSIPWGLLADGKVNEFGNAGSSLPTTYLMAPDGAIRLIFSPSTKEFNPKEIEGMLTSPPAPGPQ